MKRVRWAPAAVKDLQGVRSYFAEDEHDLARRHIDRTILAADWLLDRPYAVREISSSGRHKWKPRSTPYILIYRPVHDGIEVSRVRHERENWLDDL